MTHLCEQVKHARKNDQTGLALLDKLVCLFHDQGFETRRFSLAVSWSSQITDDCNVPRARRGR